MCRDRLDHSLLVQSRASGLIAADSDATSPGTGTGRVTIWERPPRTPMESPTAQQERNAAVSGGGVADTPDEDAEKT